MEKYSAWKQSERELEIVVRYELCAFCQKVVTSIGISIAPASTNIR